MAVRKGNVTAAIPRPVYVGDFGKGISEVSKPNPRHSRKGYADRLAVRKRQSYGKGR